MLRQTTLNQALTLSQQLFEKGQMAVAKPNTILNELVGLSTTLIDLDLKEEQHLQDQFQYIESTSQGTLDNPSQHSLQQDAIIKDLANVVTSHISFAKNIVKPLVVEMANAIQQYQTTYKPKTAMQQFNIEPLYLAEILDDESFLDTLKAYKGKPILRPDIKLTLESKTTEALYSLITTGVDRLDKLLLAWLSDKPEGFLMNLFNSFCTRDRTGYGYDDIDRLNLFSRIDAFLALVLLTRKLYDTVDETSGLDLSTYRNAVMQLRDYAGGSLYRDLISLSMFNRSERLVMDVSQDRYTVRVNGIVYDAWLQAGNVPETLFGYILSGDPGSSKAAIDNQSKEYLSRWNSYCLFYNTNESNKALDYFKDFVKQTLSLSMKELTDVETAYSQKNPQHYETIKVANDAYIDGLKKDDMAKVYDIALTVVAKHRFYFTSAYCILSDIHEASKANPNIEVREAALIAVINYLSDYFKQQITFVNA